MQCFPTGPLAVGRLPKGKRNSIADIKGVRVGHATIDTDQFKTGVTVIMPCERNPYFQKLVAAVHILNGYGKSAGLIQIMEVGTLETPIALTSTLNVGLVHDGLVQAMLDWCHAENQYPTSINPIVCECHDGMLSDIARRPVGAAHVKEAIERATEDFAQGSVGAGRGLTCHGFKGGIGSSSRVVEMDGQPYALGILAMTNHGQMEDFMMDGQSIGKEIASAARRQDEAERGSVILVVATDLPVDSRQLGRILRRVPVGLARVGSHMGHGSGDIVVGFTTANTMPHEGGSQILSFRVLREDALDLPFRAAIECAEEAVLRSMLQSETTTGYRGNTIFSLADAFEQTIRQK